MPSQDDPARTRPLADVLQEYNKGRTHAEASRELQELVQAVRETGKKGSLTLTINLSPSKMEGGMELVVTAASKKPRFDQPASLFFSDDEGNLTRHDPRQMELPIGPTRLDTDRQENAQ